MRIVTAFLIALVALPAAAQTRQAIYDAAQGAFDKGDWQGAIDGFARVLADERHPSRTDGLIRTRYASALFNLGRDDEAERQIVRAIDEFPPARPDDDLAAAQRLHGNLLRQALAMDAALAAYDQARAAMGPNSPDRLGVTTGTMLAAMVTRPDVAVATGEATRDASSFKAMTRAEQSQLLTLLARAQLNAGETKQATATITRAVDLAGPLDTRVTLTQAIVRADAGLILAFGGDVDSARKYLAYSGAGQMPSADWASGVKFDLPVCGDDVRPDDMAVVEFAIGSDGRTLAAAPVYASRPGAMGLIFAEKTRTWRWNADTMSKLGAFWRSTLRLELRCVSRPAPLQLSASFIGAARDWFAGKGMQIDLGDYGLGPAGVGAKQPADTERLAATLRRGLGTLRPGERGAKPAEIDGALAAAGAPTDVRALFAYWANRGGSGLIELTHRIKTLPDSARAFAWLATETALALERSGDLDAARAYLQAALATPLPAMPQGDPVRTIATLHLSTIDRRQGKAAAADARIVDAGLDAEQCSLFDVRPTATNTAVGSSAFPAEALRWGFEGFAREAFDIAANGSVERVRTIVAYPPLVFGPATQKTVARFRYVPPTLDGRALGCAGQTMNVRYIVPR